MTKPHEEKLFTFKSGGWVLLVAGLLTLVAAGLVLYPVYETGFHQSVGDGRNADTYGFDLSKLTIPRDELVASGYAKDEIHAVVEKLVETALPEQVDLIAANEHIRFLVPADLVIGVVFNGVARAYPARILNIHEVVNDTVGGVPLLVTWSPLCGSAVVFDRRVDGAGTKPVEFGVSGLLYQSDLIMFDRRSQAKDESLWPQLSFHAIAGPAVGKSLTLVDSDVMTWKDWRAAHPDTQVFLGLRTLKEQYGDAQDPINLYLSNDDLKFAVTPYWNSEKFPRKTRIVVTSDDLLHFTATLPETTAKGTPTTATAPTTSATTGPKYRISTFLFAWYAQHPQDTDYSALK